MQRIIRSVLFGDVRHVVVPEAHDYVTFVRCLVCEDFDLIEDAPLPVCMVSSLVNIHGRLFVIDDQRTRLDLPIAIELSKELARRHDVTDVLVASLELIREDTKQLSAPFFLSFRYSFWQVHARGEYPFVFLCFLFRTFRTHLSSRQRLRQRSHLPG